MKKAIKNWFMNLEFITKLRQDKLESALEELIELTKKIERIHRNLHLRKGRHEFIEYNGIEGTQLNCTKSETDNGEIYYFFNIDKFQIIHHSEGRIGISTMVGNLKGKEISEMVQKYDKFLHDWCLKFAETL